ncbi:MAG: RIP metalloprotease RseP [Clostridia bacterium]|nr:RIP metalloprotease RseP [Clostridia bacterium]
MIVSIIVVLVMLGIIVTIHELGHFWVAKLLKIKAYEVSIFVGPILASWKRKGVDYSIRAIPLGAYVRFSDFDENGDVIVSDDPQLLINQPRWKRFLVAIAGPVMNAILGVVLFTILYSCISFTSLDVFEAPVDSQLYATEYNPGDRIYKINGHRVWNYIDMYFEIEKGSYQEDDMIVTFKASDTGELYDVTLVPELKTRPMMGIKYYRDTDNKYNGWEIISVMPEQNGGHPVLKEGDYLTEINGVSVEEALDNPSFTDMHDGDNMTLTYIRNGEEFTADCVTTTMTYANDRGLNPTYKKVGSFADFLEAFGYAAKMPISVANVSVKSIASVFDGREKVYNMVSGPVGVTTAVSDVVQDVDQTTSFKLVNLLNLSAMISIALTFSNLLPIPGLDGIQIILLFVEMILGRPISKKAENVITVLGFILIVLLVIFAFTSDIVRIFAGGM